MIPMIYTRLLHQMIYCVVLFFSGFWALNLCYAIGKWTINVIVGRLDKTSKHDS